MGSNNNLHTISKDYNQLYSNNDNYQNPGFSTNNVFYSTNSLNMSNNNLNYGNNNSLIFSRGQGIYN
jgi:hypothetical protein